MCSPTPSCCFIFGTAHTDWSGTEQQSSGMDWQAGLSRSLLHLPPSLLSRHWASSPECVWSNHSRWLHHDLNPSLLLSYAIPSSARERERGCCSKSPLPCFCCTYYAICFRSLIRVLADHKDTECVWERKRSIQDLSGTLYTKPTVTDRPAAMETSEPYGHSLI